MPKIPSTFDRIQELRQRYLQEAVTKKELITLINEAEIPEHVYNSNAIENSTLTLEETEKILLQIDLDRYITEREIFEAKNLARVMAYIETKSKEQEVNIDLILLLHRMLLSNIRDDVAGRFRQEGEWVKVGTHIAPNPNEVVDRINKLLIEYHTSSEMHIVKKLAKFHLNFEYTHPFVDGNGRIGRVLMNYLLMREDYAPINIKFIDKTQYYNAFNEFETKNSTSKMELIVGRALTNSFHKRLAYVEDRKIITLKEYSTQTNQSLSNLLNKAHRQTIGAFLEKGVWKIGV